MKPDFDSMSKEELKAYVLAHKSDTEAFYKLADRFTSRQSKFSLVSLSKNT